MQRRAKAHSSLPQEHHKAPGDTDARRAEQQHHHEQRSPARPQANGIPASAMPDAPPPSLVLPERLDSFICVIGDAAAASAAGVGCGACHYCHCLTFCHAAAAVPRYANDIGGGGDINGALMVRTLLQWGTQSGSDAVRAAVAQALAALCRSRHRPAYSFNAFL
jgi:hypothetical protein